VTLSAAGKEWGISEVECTTGKNSACEGFGQLSFEENALIAVLTKRLCRF
jgi:hypothetical protein